MSDEAAFIVSFIVDEDYEHPCGCVSPERVQVQVTYYNLGVAECPDCGATWDDCG